MFRRLPEDKIELVNDSLDRCVGDPTFLDRFYERFLSQSDEIAAIFAHTEMKRQKRMLKASLYTAILAADGNRPAIEHLFRLNRIHKQLGVREEHYEMWTRSLIASVEETFPGHDPPLTPAWEALLDLAVSILQAELPAAEG